MAKRICIGALAGPHGVRGDFKIRSFTADPADVAAYGQVEAEKGGRRFTLKLLRMQKPGVFIAQAPEIKTREEAETLKGTKLFIARSCLPPPDEDEFYHEDLVGLKAQDADGNGYGKIKAVLNFGAGDLLELFQIPEVKGTRLLEFSHEYVPVIDFENNCITVSPPEDFLKAPPKDPGEAS